MAKCAAAGAALEAAMTMLPAWEQWLQMEVQVAKRRDLEMGLI